MGPRPVRCPCTGAVDTQRHTQGECHFETGVSVPQAVELPEERPAEFLSGAAGAHAGLGPAASRAARLPFCCHSPQLVVRRGSLGKALRSFSRAPFSAKPPGPSFHTVSLLSALCPFPYRIISLYPSAKSGRSRLSGAGPRAAPGRPPWLRAPSSQRCAGRGAGRADPGRPAPRVFPARPSAPSAVRS